VPRGQVALNEL
jgi:ABC-type antimicrobial peptide transport system permease subunit